MDKNYLKLLEEMFPDTTSIKDELISLNASLYLPKGTEYFFSDIHGESNAFLHLLRSASGNIREKIERNPKKPKYLKVVWGTGYKVG